MSKQPKERPPAHPASLRIDVHFDAEVQRFWATSPDLNGLTVEADTHDELRQEALWAAETLLALAGAGGVLQLHLRDVEGASE